jgi:hypothetical protein
MFKTYSQGILHGEIAGRKVFGWVIGFIVCSMLLLRSNGNNCDCVLIALTFFGLFSQCFVTPLSFSHRAAHKGRPPASTPYRGKRRERLQRILRGMEWGGIEKWTPKFGQ